MCVTGMLYNLYAHDERVTEEFQENICSMRVRYHNISTGYHIFNNDISASVAKVIIHSLALGSVACVVSS